MSQYDMISTSSLHISSHHGIYRNISDILYFTGTCHNMGVVLFNYQDRQLTNCCKRNTYRLHIDIFTYY